MTEQKDDMQPIAVDVYGAGRLLGLGRSSVLGLAARGELTPLRFGRAVRYARSDVEALVERRRSEVVSISDCRGSRREKAP